MREFIICVLIWFSMLAIVGFISWLKDRKRRKRMTGYNELRDGQEFYGNGYKKGYEDAKKEYARPKGEWARYDEWRGGEYIGGFYHVNCPCEDGYFVKWPMKYCGNCGAPMQLNDKVEGGAEE